MGARATGPPIAEPGSPRRRHRRAGRQPQPPRRIQAARSRALRPPPRRRPPNQGRPPRPRQRPRLQRAPRPRQLPPSRSFPPSCRRWAPSELTASGLLAAASASGSRGGAPVPDPTPSSVSRWHRRPESASARLRRRAGLGSPAAVGEGSRLQPGIPSLVAVFQSVLAVAFGVLHRTAQLANVVACAMAAVPPSTSTGAGRGDAVAAPISCGRSLRSGRSLSWAWPSPPGRPTSEHHGAPCGRLACGDHRDRDGVLAAGVRAPLDREVRHLYLLLFTERR
jgi:hypothetical protein